MKVVAAAEAAEVVRSGDRVYVHCAAATPSVLLQALVDRAPELTDVTVVHLHTEGPGPHLAPEMAGHFRHRALFIGPNARAAVNEGRADYVPVFLSDVPRLFDEPAPCRSTWCSSTRRRPTPMASARSARASRRCTRPIRAATTVVAQLNRSMPRTLGDSFIHVDDIDLGVEVDVPPYVHAGPVDRRRRAAHRRARRGPRAGRATLQLGIGAIPAATAMALTDKHDLGIHTEMFTDAVVDLVEAGVVTGAAKERNRGKIVTTFLMGSPRLYAFVHDNPMVEMRPVDFTNDTHVIRLVQPDGLDQLGDRGRPDRPGRGGLDRPHDVLGRRRPDGLHPRAPRSPPRAARSSRCHRPRPAGRHRGSSRSCAEGAGVVTTRAHVRTVVTEWGVAELFGLEPPGARRGADRHRPPGLPRRPPSRGGATQS